MDRNGWTQSQTSLITFLQEGKSVQRIIIRKEEKHGEAAAGHRRDRKLARPSALYSSWKSVEPAKWSANRATVANHFLCIQHL
jgi:hypothetical protein